MTGSATKNGPTMRDAALKLALKGFAVFPIKRGYKEPPPKGWQAMASAYAMDAFDNWTAPGGASANHNIGILGRDHLILDVDVPGDSHAIDGRAALAALGWQGKTFTVRTPSGGLHLYFKKPADEDYKQSDLAPGINVRSSGGYALGPGSWTKRIDGKQAEGFYQVIDDSEPAPLPECVRIKLKLAGSDVRYDESSYAGEWDSPASVDWCWDYIRNHAPEAKSGNRGATGLRIAHRLGDHAITKPLALEMLREWHENKCDPAEDETNQMESVLNSAYSNRESPIGSECWHDLLTPIEVPSAAHTAASGAWPEPDMSLVTSRVLPAPRLPLDAFGTVAPLINDVATSRCAAPDYPAAALLAIASALIGSTRNVQAWAGWQEPLSLFCVAVGTPSQAKTPLVKPLMKPLHQLENKLTAIAAAQAAVYEIAKKVWSERKEAWDADAEAALKTGQEPPPMPDEPVKPASGRIVASDSTPERLAQLLANQPRGLLWSRDELAELFSTVGHNGGRDARGFVLELWNGLPGRRERAGGEDVKIPYVLASLLGTIQPEMLEAKVFSREDNGLTGRMLMFWPDWTPRERPQADFDASKLTHIYERLIGLKHGPDIEPIVVPLTAEAANAFEVWWKRDGDVLHAMPEGLEKGAHGKAAGYVLRLACVLEFLWWAAGHDTVPPRAVSVAAVRSAIRLADEYFAPMRRRVLSAGTVLEADKFAKTLAAKIREQKAPSFTVSQLKESWGLRLPPKMHEREKSELIIGALRELADRGWVRNQDRKPGQLGGRRTVDYIVNPAVF